MGLRQILKALVPLNGYVTTDAAARHSTDVMIESRPNIPTEAYKPKKTVLSYKTGEWCCA